MTFADLETDRAHEGFKETPERLSQSMNLDQRSRFLLLLSSHVPPCPPPWEHTTKKPRMENVTPSYHWDTVHEPAITVSSSTITNEWFSPVSRVA